MLRSAPVVDPAWEPKERPRTQDTMVRGRTFPRNPEGSGNPRPKFVGTDSIYGPNSS